MEKEIDYLPSVRSFYEQVLPAKPCIHYVIDGTVTDFGKWEYDYIVIIIGNILSSPS